MAGPGVSQSSGHSRWKQWWRRSPNTCCSKKILVWNMLFTFSLCMLLHVLTRNAYILIFLVVISYSSGPLIGWLADVRFGRYEVIF